MNSNEDSELELSAIGVASPTPVNSALTLWASRLGASRDSECRVHPRQTDAVDQFVSGEANGYKAGLLETETRSFYPMSSNEVLSAIGVASPTPANPHDEG